ncbi:MAG: hypothetical protein AAGF97_04845 [Planctomycetota bacterium]
MLSTTPPSSARYYEPVKGDDGRGSRRRSTPYDLSSLGINLIALGVGVMMVKALPCLLPSMRALLSATF